MPRAEFPTGFANELYHVTPTDIAKRHSHTVQGLEAEGFVVGAGLRPSDVPALTEIAGQAGTLEFCPNDLAKRWTDEDTARAQLAKGGGRAVFQLIRKQDEALAGYGWVGLLSEDDTERQLTGMPYTFALRINEEMRGRGLAKPFSRLIVAGAMGLYGARGIGLETWASNTRAVGAYLGAEAVTVAHRNAVRPTLDLSRPHEIIEGKPHVHDTRVYMKYPWSR